MKIFDDNQTHDPHTFACSLRLFSKQVTQAFLDRLFYLFVSCFSFLAHIVHFPLIWLFHKLLHRADETAVHGCNSWLSVWTLSCRCLKLSTKYQPCIIVYYTFHSTSNSGNFEVGQMVWTSPGKKLAQQPVSNMFIYSLLPVYLQVIKLWGFRINYRTWDDSWIWQYW